MFRKHRSLTLFLILLFYWSLLAQSAYAIRAVIDGGTIDATPIGGTTPSTGEFTDITITGNVIGNLTGDGTGNISGFDNITNTGYGGTSRTGDIITKGPQVDVRAYMDGQSGRPTQAAWEANQTGTVVTSVIQAALNTNKRVKMPDGYFLVDNTLTLPVGTGVRKYSGGLFGAGNAQHTGNDYNYGTWIVVTDNTFNKPLFELNNTYNFQIKDLALIGPGKTVSGSIAIKYTNVSSYNLIEGVGIDYWETGLQAGSPASGGVSQDQGQNEVVTIRWSSIGISENVKYSIRKYSSQAMMWNVDHSRIGGEHAVKCENSTAPAYTGAGVSITNSFITSTDYIIDNPSSYGIFTFTNNHLENGGVGDPPIVVNGGVGANTASTGVNFYGNNFNYGSALPTSTTPFIVMDGGGPLTFIGNKISHPNPIININMLGRASFFGNNWRIEPRFYSTGASNGYPQLLTRIGDVSAFYNDGTGLETNGISWQYGEGFALGRNRIVFGTAVPTAGTWYNGDIIYNTSNINQNGGLSGWLCYQAGTFSAASTTGNTTVDNNIVTGVDNTSAFHVNDWVNLSAGGSGTSRILQKTTTTLTLDLNSSSTQTGVTISTPDPLFVRLQPVMRAAAPGSDTEACVAGSYYYDANYWYWCYSTNNWRRVAYDNTW